MTIGLAKRDGLAKRGLILASACAAACLLAACGGGGGEKTGPAAAGARAPSGSYVFWPPAPDEPRIQFVRTFQSLQDVSQKQASGLERMVFGREVEDSNTINKPYGVAMHDGKIYVCDIRNRCLTVLDLRKKQTRLVGVSGANKVKHPVAVAIGEDGAIYVADNERSAVMVFDAAERFVKAIGHEKFKPAGLAVHGARLYASDTVSQLVEVFDTRDGRSLGTIGSIGDEDGQFRLPLGVATDAKGDVYVADMMRCRVQKFTPEGKFIWGLGAQGDYAGAFVRPKHLSVDSDGIIYVVDAGFQNVQMFNSEGKTLMHFGSAGAFPGAMDLPAGICVSEDSLDVLSDLVHPGFKARRLLVVTNQMGNNRVSVYAMGGLREGYTAADLSKNAASIATGVGAPTPDELKFANPGTVAPGSEGAPGGDPATATATATVASPPPPPANPAPTPKAPAPKPVEPAASPVAPR